MFYTINLNFDPDSYLEILFPLRRMNGNRLYKGTFNSELNENIKGELEMVTKFNKKLTIEDDRKLYAYVRYKGSFRANEIFKIEIEPSKKSKFLSNTPFMVPKKIHMGEFSSQEIEASINLADLPNSINGKYACIKPADTGRFVMALTNCTDYLPSNRGKNNTECIIL